MEQGRCEDAKRRAMILEAPATAWRRRFTMSLRSGARISFRALPLSLFTRAAFDFEPGADRLPSLLDLCPLCTRFDSIAFKVSGRRRRRDLLTRD